MAREPIYKRKQDLVVREIAGEVFLVPVRGKLAQLSRLFVLNALGVFLWDRLVRECTLGDLVREVESQYEVSVEQARQDVEKFLEELTAAELVARVPDTEAEPAV